MPVGQTPGRCRRRPRPQAEREGEGAFGWTSGSFRYLAARKVVARRAVTQGHAARRVLPRPRPRGDRGRLAAGSFAEGTQLVRLTAVAPADDPPGPMSPVAWRVACRTGVPVSLPTRSWAEPNLSSVSKVLEQPPLPITLVERLQMPEWGTPAMKRTTV